MATSRWFFTVAVLAVLAALGSPMHTRLSAQEITAGFRPLFNERDLTGWVLVNTPAETWSVRDKMLICTGRPIGELRTDRMYQNFILEVEWRHMVPKGNAGIFIWADDITARGVPFHRGIEVQVLENDYGNSQSHTTHGDIFPIHGATMTPVNGRGGSRAFPTEERSKPGPEWNHYRIECRDGEISLAVNGKVVTRGTECVPRKGYICLESEGGVVHYRNLRIQELPDSPVAEEQVAIANRGYRSLYTGLDLKGWKTAVADDSSWKPNDWVLSFLPMENRTPNNETGERRNLVSDESFQDFGFLFDMRPTDEFRALSLGLGGAATPLLIDPAQPTWQPVFAKRGAWQRWEVTLNEGVLNLSVDGKPVLHDQKWSDGSGPIVLAPQGETEFANLYVRPLK